VAKDTAGNIILVPKLEIDNTEVERIAPSPATEEELIKNPPKQKDLFSKLKAELMRDGTENYITGCTSRFRKNRVFALVNLGKNKIRLRLRVGMGVVSDPDFKYGKQCDSDWGTIIIREPNELPDKVKGWIEIARNFSPSNEDEAEINDIA
jgi:hypothetical protein